ncbi:MAG: hypothetical protein JWM43_951 [Acidobacteriaceae bacterium]|nr:hypothetical protein [Acidobacteriaceae bacterium]
MKCQLRVWLFVALAALPLSLCVNAQTVTFNAVGSSALFLETGLAASSDINAIGASCVWSTATNGIVRATDVSGVFVQDSGSAWVAWNPPTGLPTTPTNCAMVNSFTRILAYLQTDSVTGVRRLVNGCTIKNNGDGISPDNMISATEVPLPSAIAAALNGSSGNGLVVNAAASDIRPEDAAFANARALAPCGTAIATGSQYLGLGYPAGDTIDSHFNTGAIHVVNFTLPTSPTIGYSVTPIGAVPVLIVANGNGSAGGFSDPSITNISSDALSKFLDGTYSYTGQANPSPSATGDAAIVILREPLAGDYNTLEYNVPNDLALQTSQEVGIFQPFSQVNCNGTAALNPMNIATRSGGARQRAISTNQELAEVIFNKNSLSYSFWNVINFKHFTSGTAPFAKYLTVDGIDPLTAGTHTGMIPTTGTTDLQNVTLTHVIDGTYPIWSILRFVTLGETSPSGVTALASAMQNLVTFGATNSRPDFVTPLHLTVIRSHFVPPAGNGQPTPAANGHVGFAGPSCTQPEAGDVGGVVIGLLQNEVSCRTNQGFGITGQRR